MNKLPVSRDVLARYLHDLGYLGTDTFPSEQPIAYWQAVLDALEARRGELTYNPRAWGRKRREMAVFQLMLKDAGQEPGAIDGLYGPSTDYAYDKWRGVELPRKDEIPVVRKATHWPSYNHLTAFYGAPGKNQVMLVPDKPMRLAWDTRRHVRRFSCHRKVQDAFRGMIADTIREYGEAEWRRLGLDLFGGCLNVRRMRGGNRWSTHAWGVAIDLDPAHNRFRWNHRKARFARPEYEPFWRIVDSYGLVSLGRSRDFDWMHIQAVR